MYENRDKQETNTEMFHNGVSEKAWDCYTSVMLWWLHNIWPLVHKTRVYRVLINRHLFYVIYIFKFFFKKIAYMVSRDINDIILGNVPH